MSTSRSRKSPLYRTRRRWKAEDAEQALADLKKSGLSASAFAEREGLSAARLLRWRRRLEEGIPAPAVFEEFRPRPIPPSLIEAAKAVDLSTYGLVLPSGEVCRLPQGFTVEMLARLLYLVSKGYGW